AVGGGGSIAVFDGETWAPKLSNDPYTRDLHGVWAFAEDNVWLAGGGGVIIRYEGSKWNLADVAGPYYKEKDWRGLWGRVTGGGGAELWTCGVDGAMLHYDGKDWKDAPSWPENDVHDVAGRQDGVAVAAGERGFLARWDGTRWITLASGTDQDLYGVTFLGDTALVVGDDGIMLEVDGDGVSPVETGLAGDLRAVCRGSDDALRVCGAGGLMAVQAEAGFQLIQTATVQDLFDCYCGSEGEVLAVGALGTALRHHAGDAAATAEAVPTAATLRRLDGPGFDDLVAVGDNGVAVRRTGGAWEKIRDESATFLYGVRWDGTTAVAVGWSGTVMWWDGETWTVEQLPSVGVLEQVWGLTPEHLVAVGKKGLFLRYLAPEDES
ncbi:MAG: hypothetical protein FJ098_11265, partial [Deltaproteobacteria bacterium]|nr:hypothetical protein [Deltaproteobacteria bacterium]